jgi:hypothetical protein
MTRRKIVVENGNTIYAQSKPVSSALQRHDTLHICDSAGARIRCLTGKLWITQEGDSRDNIIGPGQTFVLDRRGLTLVHALRASRVSTEGVIMKPTGYCLEASARRLRAAMLRGLWQWLRGHVLPLSCGARAILRRS